MGDVIAATIKEFVAMLMGALRSSGPWQAAAVVVGATVFAAAVRGKLTAPWVWIPVLAGAAYWVVYRWLRLQYY